MPLDAGKRNVAGGAFGSRFLLLRCVFCRVRIVGSAGPPEVHQVAHTASKGRFFGQNHNAPLFFRLSRCDYGDITAQRQQLILERRRELVVIDDGSPIFGAEELVGPGNHVVVALDRCRGRGDFNVKSEEFGKRTQGQRERLHGTGKRRPDDFQSRRALPTLDLLCVRGKLGCLLNGEALLEQDRAVFFHRLLPGIRAGIYIEVVQHRRAPQRIGKGVGLQSESR